MDNEKCIDGTLSRSKKKYDYNPASHSYSFKPGANPKSPDYNGTFKLDTPSGTTVLYASAWMRERKETGEKFLSVSLEYPKNETRRVTLTQGDTKADDVTSRTPAENVALPDEELPF